MSLNTLGREEPYRYITLRGNNSELVKRCLDEREWQEIQSTNTLFNFKWAPFSKGIRFDYLTGHGQRKMVNHFESHEQLSEKDNLFFNMTRHYEQQRKNVFAYLPVTFVVDLSSTQSVTEIERFQIYFNLLEKHKSDKLGALNKEVMGNHMFLKSKQYTKYTMCPNMFDGKNFWLIKPTDFNRGRGVQVFNTLEQFKKLIIEYQQGVEVKLNPSQPERGGPPSKSPDPFTLIMKKLPSALPSTACTS
jgi:Tubulin-tyrosine ligase family